MLKLPFPGPIVDVKMWGMSVRYAKITFSGPIIVELWGMSVRYAKISFSWAHSCSQIVEYEPAVC